MLPPNRARDITLPMAAGTQWRRLVEPVLEVRRDGGGACDPAAQPKLRVGVGEVTLDGPDAEREGDGDPESFRNVDPSWAPTLPSRVPDRFTIADLLVPHDASPT